MFSGVFWCGPSESEVANRPARPTSLCILCGICRVPGVAHLFVAQFVAQKGKFMDRLLWFLFLADGQTDCLDDGQAVDVLAASVGQKGSK